jgi:hypothetical protein
MYPSKPEEIGNKQALDSWFEVLKITDQFEHFIFQVKKNGLRAIVWIENENTVSVYNREGTILSASSEYDWSKLGHLFPPHTLLDGELIGRRQGEHSNKLYIWDVPIINKQHIYNESYKSRTDELLSLYDYYVLPRAKKINKSYIKRGSLEEILVYDELEISIARNIPIASEDPLFIDKQISYIRKDKNDANEGLVFKDTRHSMDWSLSKTSVISAQKKLLFKKM